MYALVELWEDDGLVTSRATRGGAPDLVVVTPAALTASHVTRLQRAFALRAELDPRWAIQPQELVTFNGRPALIGAAPPADVLAAQLVAPWELGACLRVAIGIATALRELHARGIVHKDIKPANVLANREGGAWLTGFGIATRLPRERQPPLPPEVIEGTLAYMAPEQSGRMNRSIDSRTDLYAFGVTLYELLAGRLPFTANDPMEWVHAHMARQPAPLRHPHQPIPIAVVDIVMKLLEKTADARYQTAAGVEHDLRRALAAWTTHGSVERFPLGERDISDRLLVRERLYGRDGEIRALLSSFGRVVDSGVTELVLVSGYSGIGKSSIVNELHRVLVPPRGLYAAGKFDQYKRDIPYATLAQAFQSLIRHVLGVNEIVVWRERLLLALGANGQLITNLVPELELVIGPQPAPAELPPKDAQRRFRLVVGKFLAVFAQAEHPLALFLDDLQWLDAATLDLLEHLVGDPELGHLLLIGAYRENEVATTSPLARMLERIRGGASRVSEIVLAPLDLADIIELCVDTLSVTAESARPLAELVHEKTGGNPFFAIQFLTELAEEKLLFFEGQRWRWDIAAIHAKRFTDNIVELMSAKLQRLGEPTRRALGQLALLGNHAQIATLSLVYGIPELGIDAAMQEAVAAGMVSRTHGSYAFVHDRVHEAAYATVPAGEHAAEHLRLGRILAARGTEDVFDVVNHLNRGASLMTSLDERDRLAALNAVAAQRAKRSMANAAAYTYVAFGRSLLGPDAWERDFRLTFELELQLADCEFRAGELDGAEARLDRLAHHARTLTDRAAVIYTQTTLYTAMAGRTDRAIQICLEYLERIGISWSPHPDETEVAAEYGRLLTRIAGRSTAELLAVPLSTEVEHTATLDVLVGLLTPAFNSDHHLASLILCRLANLSLEHGHTEASSIGFAFLAMTVVAKFENYALGRSLSELAIELAEQRGLTRHHGRIHHAIGCHVLPWLEPLGAAEQSIRLGMDLMFAAGDVTYSAFAYCALITNLLGSGKELVLDENLAEEGLAQMRKVKFDMGADIMHGHLRLAQALRGKLANPTSLDPGRAFVGELSAAFYWIRILQACFIFGDEGAARVAAAEAEQRIETTYGFFERVEYVFYAALVRTDDVAVMHAHRDRLAGWAVNCPANFADRVALVDAEIARIEGRPLDAMEAYEHAIGLAQANELVHHEAIAFELAARFYAARRFGTIANAYFDRARSAYARWGATGKVAQLDRLHLPIDVRAIPAEAAPVDLDLAMMVRTSEAVTTEIDLDKLIETLMIIALEHAGAERGLLILPRNGELYIEAEASTAGVQRRRGLARYPDLPETIIHYVSRTQELVLLADARDVHGFSADAYLREHRSRSVVCVPLVKQAELIGLLYLENQLAPHVFTTPRIAVLKLLASQAAVSLENASLEQENATLGEKESLLQEVHHRVKNNLQLISSLLNLQASRVADPAVAELFAESRNRVRAMALVHENLYRAGNFARIPMAAHIRTLCAHLARAYNLTGQTIALETDVEDIHLEMNRAVSCGLIINELFSNALKHAFPAARSGAVKVALRAEQSSYVLTVGDNGIGLPADAESGDSLGLQLVRDLTDQLHGTLVISRESGSLFTLRFAQ